MDYSPYYFKNYRKGNRQYEAPEYKAPRKKRRWVKAVAVIALAFVLVAAADALTDGRIRRSLTDAVNVGKDKYYVLIASEHASETEAVAAATVVRANGGAGYIINENDEYFVALATYLNEEDAVSVESKNQGTFIKEIEIGYSLFPGTGDMKKRLVDLTERAVDKFSEISADYSAKVISAGSALNEITEIRNDFFELKADLLETERGEDEEAILAMTDVFFAASEAVLSGGYSTTELESVLRYVTTLFAYNSR